MDKRVSQAPGWPGDLLSTSNGFGIILLDSECFSCPDLDSVAKSTSYFPFCMKENQSGILSVIKLIIHSFEQQVPKARPVHEDPVLKTDTTTNTYRCKSVGAGLHRRGLPHGPQPEDHQVSRNCSAHLRQVDNLVEFLKTFFGYEPSVLEPKSIFFHLKSLI